MAGNGVDLAAIYQAIVLLGNDLRDLRAAVGEMRKELSGKADRTDVESLRQTLNDYHHAVVGHGIMLTDHDERLTTLEQAAKRA